MHDLADRTPVADEARLGTRFLVYPQPPFVPGYERPEVVCHGDPHPGNALRRRTGLGTGHGRVLGPVHGARDAAAAERNHRAEHRIGGYANQHFARMRVAQPARWHGQRRLRGHGTRLDEPGGRGAGRR